MKRVKTRDEWLNEGHSYDNEIEKARMMQGSASDLVEWAARKIAESRPENFQEGIISPINEAKAPKSWDTMFAMNVLKAYEDGNELLRKGDPKSIEKWDTDYNGGNKPKPSFETKAIIDYAISTAKKPNGDKFNESLNEMKMVNKDTGKDITKYVIQYMEKKITKKEFEKLTGLKKDELKVDEDSNIFEALNFIIRPAKSGDPFEPYGKPFFIQTKDADLVVKKMNDLGIRTFTNKNGDEYEVGLETFDPRALGYHRTFKKLVGINQDVLQKALDVLDQRKDKITGFGWMSTNESEDLNEKNKVDVASLSIGNTYKDNKGYPVKVIDIKGTGNRWKITYQSEDGKKKTVSTSLDKGINLYESVNEAHLGDKLYPDGADEADGKAIKKLLEPYKKKWVTASSMMDNRDFDAGLREYIMDFEPEAIKNKKDLVEDFADYLSAMGYTDTLSVQESVNEASKITTKGINDIENGDVIVLGKNKHFKVDYIDPWSGGGRILVGKDVKTGKKGKMKVKFLTPRGNTGIADDTILNVLDESTITEGKKSEEWMVTYKSQNFAGVKIKNGTVIKVLARNTEEAHKKAAKKLGLKDYYHALDAKATKVNESKWIPYSGFVNESPNIIANTIYENSNNSESAIAILEKCISDNYTLLNDYQKANLEIAKRLLESKY